ncbi:S-adenosyl-L-methionine-dependent methyltransferase [Aspergillus ambiguus]|uniref:S-adenosyl-L-methionine-dependent methyltransferase n=1 Tax=Aspergillus ambiguus TaxID=176160 RepID=UPI003CCCAA68
MDQNWLRARNNHTYENGRRYHGFKGEFPFPDDREAASAHGTINTIWCHLLDGKTFVSPIGDSQLQKNHKVLEFATRSGSWAGVVLQQQQPPRLTGMDATHMSRDTKYFIHHDLEAEWPFTSKQAFHLIHAQSLGGLIADYDGFYARAYRHLVPGGWLEVWEKDLRFFTESNNEQDEGRLAALRQWEALMEEAAARFGKRINVAAEQKDLTQRAGFVEVAEQVFRVPFGKWSDDPRMKNIGGFYKYQMQCALEGYTLRLVTKTLGWSKEDTDALLGRVREELQQEELRLYSNFRLIIGKKPTESAR